VLLCVSDTGSGIDAETAQHLFEPFYTTKGKGTGLGLSTVYGVVRQNRGVIRVESAPGQGTTFRIYLPQAEAGACQAPSVGVPAVAPKGSATVLVVEDQEGVRRFTVEVLRNLGYQVLEASDGPSALEASQRHPGIIHLLLTDLVMPGMNGRELSEKLRRQRPEMRVLFMSGYTDEVLGQHGVLEPHQACLTKPFSSSALASKVEERLQQAA
jgi:CheY-like chemotaxis protein